MRVAIYARVSTTKQEEMNQVAVLRKFAEGRGDTIVEEYIDKLTGSTDDRPRFKAMFEAASRHEFDLVLFWALDRFTREGVLPTLKHLERLRDSNVAFKSFTEQYLDSTGMFAEAIIAILAALAKQERLRLKERVNAGLDRIRRRCASCKEPAPTAVTICLCGGTAFTGRALGPKPLVRPKLEIVAYHNETKSLRKTAKKFRVSKDYVAQVLKEIL